MTILKWVENVGLLYKHCIDFYQITIVCSVNLWFSSFSPVNQRTFLVGGYFIPNRATVVKRQKLQIKLDLSKKLGSRVSHKKFLLYFLQLSGHFPGMRNGVKCSTEIIQAISYCVESNLITIHEVK